MAKTREEAEKGLRRAINALRLEVDQAIADNIESRLEALLATLSTPREPEVEPVAWLAISEWNGQRWSEAFVHKIDADGYADDPASRVSEIAPLYRSPPTDEDGPEGDGDE